MTSHGSSTRKLSQSAWDALADAIATFYWYKVDLRAFLHRRLDAHPEILAQLDFELTKRQVAYELVGCLSRFEPRYQGIVIDLLVELSRFDPEFPRLAALDDGSRLVDQARAAHAAVLNVVGRHAELVEQREELRSELAEQKERAEARRSHEVMLGELRDQFIGMHAMPDAHERGRRFEVLLNRLFELHDLQPRAAYSLEHEQIDGAFTFDTDDYLLEAKWWSKPLQPAELHEFKAKLESKAKHTLGLLIAVNGFTAGAIDSYSHATPLLLMDGGDLIPILESRITLAEVLHRKRRHAAETGNPLLRVSAMLS